MSGATASSHWCLGLVGTPPCDYCGRFVFVGHVMARWCTGCQSWEQECRCRPCSSFGCKRLVCGDAADYCQEHRCACAVMGCEEVSTDPAAAVEQVLLTDTCGVLISKYWRACETHRSKKLCALCNGPARRAFQYGNGTVYYCKKHLIHGLRPCYVSGCTKEIKPADGPTLLCRKHRCTAADCLKQATAAGCCADHY
jgi:hypothetical protein